MAARTARGWTRADLAEAMGWEREAVRRIEAGRAAVTVEDLAPLAAALGVPIMVLLVEPGEDAPEVVVTVTRHYCERCQGRRGQMETLVSTDLAALDGVIGLNRGLAEQARVLAAAMDECPDPTKLSALSRELRMVMDTLNARVAPSSDSGKKGKSGGGGADFADLGVPVISA
jgi:hypothetical protein